MRITLSNVITNTSPTSDKELIVNLTLQVIPSPEMGSRGYGYDQARLGLVQHRWLGHSRTTLFMPETSCHQL
ncbi:hypothetical protein M0804_001732 [Polistes exclamans]|nr:hypothetical protein M0804_001732 [Polistes exclamans]